MLIDVKMKLKLGSRMLSQAPWDVAVPEVDSHSGFKGPNANKTEDFQGACSNDKMY